MNLISEQLQVFVCDSISPQKLITKQIPAEEFNKWDHFILKEVEALKILIYFSSVKDNGINECSVTKLFNQLVSLSNIVSSYLFKGFNILKHHPQANEIKKHYKFSRNLLDELVSGLEKSFPQESKKIKITASNMPDVIGNLKYLYNNMLQNISGTSIDHQLQEILDRGFNYLIGKKGITNSDVEYITSLCSLIIRTKPENSPSMIDLLLANDFNIPDFFLYCLNTWEERLVEIPGLHEQSEMLLREKDRILKLKTQKGLRMPGVPIPLIKEMKQFLNEKQEIVAQLTKIRRQVIEDSEKLKSGKRFLVNLPVSQLGLFIRLQIEMGLLLKEHVGEIFIFFATHFYTNNALFISPQSLQKKSTDVEFATAQKLKKQIIGMLNWLNTNYNLSNYS
ncbi:hypothetical protein [Mucilaginibacter sp. UYCu711]|uniref:hypothetical protein n=1 Tax=Mucilaginibacter sp. UYCu711 TaxID=3156339 RepID=UPI003D1F75A5